MSTVLETKLQKGSTRSIVGGGAKIPKMWGGGHLSRSAQDLLGLGEIIVYNSLDYCTYVLNTLLSHTYIFKKRRIISSF